MLFLSPFQVGGDLWRYKLHLARTSTLFQIKELLTSLEFVLCVKIFRQELVILIYFPKKKKYSKHDSQKTKLPQSFPTRLAYFQQITQQFLKALQKKN